MTPIHPTISSRDFFILGLSPGSLFKYTLNQPLSSLEIDCLIKSMPKGKSPGHDGFTNKYFQTFRELLALHLAVLFSAAADKT